MTCTGCGAFNIGGISASRKIRNIHAMRFKRIIGNVLASDNRAIAVDQRHREAALPRAADIQFAISNRIRINFTFIIGHYGHLECFLDTKTE